MRHAHQLPNQKKPPVSRQPRRYHVMDDAECGFECENPDWLVGAHRR